jgi:transposase
VRGSSTRSRTDIGRPRPFSPRCATSVSRRRACSTVRSTASSFRAYVEQFLIPTLKPNDIVVLDNLGSHKGKAVRQAIKAAGARLLFLPKYSPDLNPIEQLFAKLNGQLRKAAPRTLDAVADAIAQTLAQISKHECANYLTNAGYAST